MKVFALLLFLGVAFPCTECINVPNPTVSSTSFAASSYDENLAIKLMQYSTVSYCNDKKISHWDCGQCCTTLAPDFQLTQIFKNTTTKMHGFVGYDQSLDQILLVFAGTNPISLKEWCQDLNMPRIHEYPLCSSCSVHEGFYFAYESVSYQVRSILQKAFKAHPSAGLTITGHSLGAALSVLASIDIVENMQIQPSIIYTFGKPRIGNEAFATWVRSILKTNMYHITHGHDPVPHLPPIALGFHHSSQEVFYSGKVQDGYKLCDMSGEDPTCSDQYLADVNVKDHSDYMGIDFFSNYFKCYIL